MPKEVPIYKQRWFLIAIVVVFGYLILSGSITLPSMPSGGPGVPTLPGGTPTTPTPPTVTREAAAIQFTVIDGISSSAITSTNTKVNIIKAGSDGVIDFLNSVVRTTSVDSDPEQTGATYAQGDTLILHVSCDVDATGGTDYYDSWFYVNLVEGSPIRKLTDGCLSQVQSSPTYKYKLVSDGPATGSTVQYTSGTTNYWGIGALPVTPRTSAANLDISASHGATSLSSVTDGSTWDTTTSGSEDVDFTTTSESIWVKLDAGATNIAYGCPMYTLSSIGQFQRRDAFLLFSTNMTTIGVQKLKDKAWKVVQDSTLTSEKAFYYKLPALVPLKGNDFEKDFEIPVDASAAGSSSGYYFKAWCLDFQLEDNVAIGSTSSSVPSAYGMIGEFGLDAIIFARAYSTSSGAGANQVLSWVINTAP